MYQPVDQGLPSTTGAQTSAPTAAVPPSTTTPSTTASPTLVTPSNVIAPENPATVTTGPARTTSSGGTVRDPAAAGVSGGIGTVPQIGSSTAQTTDGNLPTPPTATVPSTETPPTVVPGTDPTTSGNAQQLPSGPARTTTASAGPTDAELGSILNDVINSDPNVVRNLTDGTLPAEDVARIRREAQDTLARLQVQSAEEAAAQNAGTPLQPQSVLATPAMLPHKFAEAQYAVYHHDVVVYIQGVDVSDWITGTVTITNNVGTEPNSCEITLDNAMNRWVLTPENITGVWRTSTDYDHADYDESAKKRIYDIKSPIGNNPVDNQSGGRLWPLDLWSPIFHKGDPIRVWIRNPLNPEANEYMPMFTGYVHHLELSRAFVSRESTIQVSCQDIRYLMRQMLTNENTVLFVQPGEILTSNASEYSSENSGQAEAPQLDAGGGAFSRNFFQNLVVSSSTYANPWANVTLFKMIKALTYAGPGEAQAIVDQASAAADASLDDQIRQMEELLASPRTDATNREQRQARLAGLRAQKEQQQARRSGQSATPQAASNPGILAEPPQYATVSATDQEPRRPPLLADAPVYPQTPGEVESERRNASGRIGRLRKGYLHRFPDTRPLAEDDEVVDLVSDPAATSGAGNGSANSGTPTQSAGVVVDGSALMTQWTSVIMFGLPDWVPDGESDNQGVPLDRVITMDASTATYWTLDQVRRTGTHTRSNRACAPDTQLVHVLKPNTGSIGDAIIQDNNYGVTDNVNVQRQWVSRLDLLAKACEAVDYKFYVSPSGDLIFEFPQYDFLPKDYNVSANIGWQPVYEFDYDLISERYNPEAGEIVNCVIVTGSLTGYTDFIDTPGNAVQELDPESFPHAIAYCPVLTMRHGVNIHTLSLPLLTDRGKLARIAVLLFQRLLSQASHYDMDVAYRPWVGLNRPVVNKEFTRYALTDSVTHTIGVREHAGPATTSLTLIYPKNVDQFGIPRFLSGGASLPIYFGVIPGTRDSIMDRLRTYASNLRTYLETFATENGTTVVPEDAFAQLERYGAPIPYGYDVWNVIGGPTGVTTLSASSTTVVSTIGQLTQDLRAAQTNIEGILYNRSIGAVTASEAADNIAIQQRRIQDIQNRLASLGQSTAEINAATTQYAVNGVRTQDTVGTEQADTLPNLPEDRLCDLDSYPNSSPLGTRQSDGSFPRKIIKEFSDSRAHSHPGVDYEADVEENVFCVHDGYVAEVGDHSDYGPFVRVYHEDQGFASVYAPVTAIVAKDASVFRNSILGTVAARGPEEAASNKTVLHFAIAVVDGTVGTNKRFVPPQRFPVDTSPLPNFGTLEYIFYDPRPIGSRQNPSLTETYHGGFDISWGVENDVALIAGKNIYSTTPGHVDRVYRIGVNQTEDEPEGNAVFIRDAEGGVHGYMHMRDHPPANIVPGAPVSINTVLGVVGNTGRSSGTHLHYQVEPGGVYGLRVDVGPRLAALAGGLACTPEISKYEAQHTFRVKRPQLLASPIRIPSDAPDTPVVGMSIDEIWRRASRGTVRSARSAPATVTITPSYTYFDSAIPPVNAYSVPFAPPPSNIAHTDTLTFAILGDTTARTAKASLQSQLRALLSRPTLTLDLVFGGSATLAEWLEPEATARRRRNTNKRRANTTTLRDKARNYDVILVSLVSSSSADFTADRIVSITRELAAHNATVLWLTHKQLPDRTASVGNQTIGQLVSLGTPRDQADSHARARTQILAAPVNSVDIENGNPTALPLVGTDTGYSSNGSLNTRGQSEEAAILGRLIVGKLRSFQENSSTRLSTPLFSDAVPPETCPPERQRVRRAPQTPQHSNDDDVATDHTTPTPEASTRPIRIYGGGYAAIAEIANTIRVATRRETISMGIPGADITAWTLAINTQPEHDVLVIEFGDVRVPTAAEVDAADAKLRVSGAVNVTWVKVNPWDSAAPTSVKTARRNTALAIGRASVLTANSRTPTRAQRQLEDDYVTLTTSGANFLATNVQARLAST